LPQVSQEDLKEANVQTSHSYNLRPRLTKRNPIYSITHVNQ